MTKLILLLELGLLLFVCSCTTVSYVGDSHLASEKVDVFYDKSEITREYKVIGQAVGDGGKVEKVMNKLVERAKLEGADAILVKDIRKEKFAVNGQGGVASSNQISASFLKY